VPDLFVGCGDVVFVRAGHGSGFERVAVGQGSEHSFIRCVAAVGIERVYPAAFYWERLVVEGGGEGGEIDGGDGKLDVYSIR